MGTSDLVAFPDDLQARSSLRQGIGTPNLVAFTGPLESGKTTCAKYLVSEFGYTRHRFAGPLKRMLRAIGLSEEQVDGGLKEAPSEILCGKSTRWALQSLGTNWGRELIGEDLWIRAWKATLPQGLVVVDDLRFPNEAQTIRSKGGLIVRVVRPGADLDFSHESESHEIPADVTVYNNGDIPYLLQQLDALMRGGKKPKWYKRLWFWWKALFR